MITIFLMGLVLSILSSMIDQESFKCGNKNLSNANKGILVLAVLSMAIPIMFLLCNWRCNCTIQSMSLAYFSIFFLLLGSTLVGLGATISMNAGNCNKVVGPSTGIWVIGTIFMIMALIQLGITVSKHKRVQDMLKRK